MRLVQFLFVILVTAVPASAQWEVLTTGLPAFPSAIQTCVSQGNLFMYLTTTTQTSVPGLFRSSDEGVTWAKADTGIDLQTISVTAFASIRNRIFAATGGYGLFVSTNNGSLWTKKAIPPADYANYGYALAVRDTVLYVGHYGISYSTDYGNTWTREKSGLPASIVSRVAYAGGSTLYLASQGIFKSTNNGVDWVSVNAGIGSLNTYDVMPIGGLVFAATSDLGLFRSSNGGASWTAVNTGLPGDAGTLAAGGGFIFVATSSGIFASSDSGNHWTYADGGTSFYLNPLTIKGNYLFANNFNGFSRHVVTDFIPAATVMQPLNSTGTLNFNSAGNQTGVSMNITSLTGAANLTVNRYSTAAVNTSFSGTPPASTSNFRWVVEVLGTPTVTGQIRIKPSLFGTTITNPGSVTIYKRSTSGAGTFVALPTTYDSGTNEFVATITGFSEFILGSTGALTGAAEATDWQPTAFRLDQNYPNPFNPTTVVGYQLPAVSKVRLVVYDLLGHEVSTLVNEVKQPGTYSVQFNASFLSSGVYFYRLHAGDYVATKRLVLVR
jgi:hypothetical protein